MATILIVDDLTANRKFLLTLLHSQGHRLLEAANGSEALDTARAEHPDLVITDVLMPVMDGYELVRQLRLDPTTSKILVVLYTAYYGEREARVVALSRGADDVLTKPADSADVLKTKEIGKGTGLGLSTTYGIIKQSNGYIWVYSELGAGTTFKVYLPRSDGGVFVPHAAAAVTAPAKREMETLLLVEDEPSVRLLSRRILDHAGYRVLEAEDGNEAERVFARHAAAIDLVVTDMVMPGCGGPELLKRLHVQAPALKVLYMSGYTDQSAAHKAGIDRDRPFLQKPFTAAAFLRQVREVLDR